MGKSQDRYVLPRRLLAKRGVVDFVYGAALMQHKMVPAFRFKQYKDRRLPYPMLMDPQLCRDDGSERTGIA